MCREGGFDIPADKMLVCREGGFRLSAMLNTLLWRDPVVTKPDVWEFLKPHRPRTVREWALSFIVGGGAGLLVLEFLSYL